MKITLELVDGCEGLGLNLVVGDSITRIAGPKQCGGPVLRKWGIDINNLQKLVDEAQFAAESEKRKGMIKEVEEAVSRKEGISTRTQRCVRINDYIWDRLTLLSEKTGVPRVRYIDAGILIICERIRKDIPIWDEDGEVILDGELE